MKIQELIKSLDNFCGLSCNSKLVGNNFIFVAVKGSREDGNKFIKEAIERGAKAIVAQSAERKAQSAKKVIFINVKDARKTLGQLAAEFYGRPSSKIKVVGITGTCGKTTISYLIEALLKEAELSPSVIGTINYRFKDEILPSKNTTPGPIEIQSMLARMIKEGSNYCLMEVSSHALDQDRTEGINFHSAIFTNLTQDHMDYHKTLNNYFNAKAKLFKDMRSRAFAVINNDDGRAAKIKKLTKAKIITYGIKNSAYITAKNISSFITHTEFILSMAKAKIRFETKLLGEHNVYNILAAVAWAHEEGIDLSIIKSCIKKFSYVPGRLEKINFDGRFSVFVDYAHTEDALKNAIQTLRQLSPKRIIAVFGCGGERDKTKRPKMGGVVSRLCDFAIITNDNPRWEDPQEIIADIKRGMNKTNFCVIPERAEAIKKSLSLAKAGDILLVAGKGHEDYQIIKDRVIHFDDRQVIKECLKSLNY